MNNPRDLVADALDYTEQLNFRRTEVVNDTPMQQVLWLETMGSQLTAWGDLSEFSTMVESSILYNVWMAWEKSTPKLDQKATAKWNYDFYTWAKAYSKKRSREPAQVTIDNKIGNYKDYVAEGIIALPELVKVPTRDETGALLPETEWPLEKFDPMRIDYGKLLRARHAAKEGLPDHIWSALADPMTTADQITAMIKGQDGKAPPINDFKLYEQEGLVYARENGRSIAVAMILSENSGDPLYVKGITHLLNSSGVHVPASSL